MKYKKNGYFFYELIVCLMIICMLISSFLISIKSFKINKENLKLTYEMKQMLVLNVLLFESGKELLISDSYNIEVIDENICLTWQDMNNEKRTICEKVWL